MSKGRRGETGLIKEMETMKYLYFQLTNALFIFITQ